MGENDARMTLMLPTTDDIDRELERVKLQKRKNDRIRNVLCIAIAIAACAALLISLKMPVLSIREDAMTPNLASGDLVVYNRTSQVEPGDVVAFYQNDQILVRRIIAGPGDYVDIDRQGNVSVNGFSLDEPYLQEKLQGSCDIVFPYRVPSDHWFVLSDNRADDTDSRNRIVGTITTEQIAGKLSFGIWPIKSI